MTAYKPTGYSKSPTITEAYNYSFTFFDLQYL